MSLLWTLLGGLAPLGVAYSLGRFCFRRVPDLIALAAGAVIESLLVLGLLAAGIAHAPAFAALAVAGLLPLVWLRPKPHIPALGGLPAAVVVGVYAVLYLIHALTPEIQPDSVLYHLDLIT